MEKDENNPKLTYNGNLHSIIIRIPENATKIDLTAYTPDETGEKIVKFHTVLTQQNLKECRKYFEEEVGYEDYDEVYVLTDEGKKYLEEIEGSDYV